MKKKLKLAGLILMAGCLLSGTVLHSDTDARNPTSDIGESGTWSGGSAGTRYTLIDDHPDASGADYLTHGTAAGSLILGFSPAFSIPSGSTDISVQVIYYDQKTASQTSAARSMLRVDIGTYFSATHNPANGVWTLRTDNWATNPATSAAWTVDDVNGVGSSALLGFGLGATDASPTIRFSSAIVQVTYTPPPPPGGKKRHYSIIVESRRLQEFERFGDFAVWRSNRAGYERGTITKSLNHQIAK
jgi:hypothetical protein